MTITDIEGIEMLKELMHDHTTSEYIDERSCQSNLEAESSSMNHYERFIELAVNLPVALSSSESGLVHRIYLDVQAAKKTDAIIKEKKYFSRFLGDIDQALIEHHDNVKGRLFGSMSEMTLYSGIGGCLGEYSVGAGIITPEFISAVDEFFSRHFNGDPGLKKRIWNQNCILKWDYNKTMKEQKRSLKKDFGRSYN